MNYIRYTFTPGFSAFLVLVSLITIVMLSGFYLMNNPVYFASLLTLYLMLIIATLVGNWLRYLNYKRTAPRIQTWDQRRGKLVDHILFDPYHQN